MFLFSNIWFNLGERKLLLLTLIIKEWATSQVIFSRLQLESTG